LRHISPAAETGARTPRQHAASSQRCDNVGDDGEPGALESGLTKMSVYKRVNGDVAILLGAGRALLMQVAHPDVAAGVADHSRFERDLIGRLRRTLIASYGLVFGTTEEADRIAARLHAVHDRVRGPGYFANDPALLLWVHATLVDSALTMYELMYGPLSEGDAEAFYSEARTVVARLGCPIESQPAGFRDFRAYVASMSATLRFSGQGRDVADALLRAPQVPSPLRPAARALSLGSLDPALRSQLQPWSAADQLVYKALVASAWVLLNVAPRHARRLHISPIVNASRSHGA
jgi:uncharacterized protein (DUF2236 family)